MESQKPKNTIVLDTGAIIRNDPSVSTLLSQSESLVTVPAIVSEIKDAATRSRVETTLKPFLILRTPQPESIKFVTDFARRTGDLAVLSKPDVQIIALAYEIECEKNGGDWRLRRVPGQKRVNGAPPPKVKSENEHDSATQTQSSNEQLEHEEPQPSELEATETGDQDSQSSELPQTLSYQGDAEPASTDAVPSQAQTADIELSDTLRHTSLEDSRQTEEISSATQAEPSPHDSGVGQEDSDSDSGGWITHNPQLMKRR